MAKQGLEVRLLQSSPFPLDVECHCQPGELLALVGPSGSGKTTVLRSIAGLYPAGSGLIRCQGEVWLDSESGINLPACKRTIGLVFQNYALFPHLTALQNVIIALAHIPKPARQQRAQILLQRVHLAGLEDRFPKTLSGGQQQRVAVARALAREPHVLLLDEPFAAVDQVTRRRLYRELAELRRSLAMPIILVTHDLEEATLLADRLTILHHGVTLQSGQPLDVATHPASALVARLMNQQNVFTARVISHDPVQKQTLLLWYGRTLEIHYQPKYPVGDNICWMIPASSVMLHNPHRRSNGERENPLRGQIVEYMVFAEYVSALIRVDAAVSILINVPAHVARRNSLDYGVEVTISLLGEHIHLMPFAQLKAKASR